METDVGKARITITIERDVPDSGSGAPDCGHDAYYLKKVIEKDEKLEGKLKVVGIQIEQLF